MSVFKIDADLKEEFIATKPTGTAKSNIRTLKLADEYEDLVGKKIYNLTFGELKEMLVSQFRNPSIGAIAKDVSILRKYIDFCIDKNKVVHCENRLVTFKRDQLKEFVSQKAVEYKYISPEDLQKYQNILENDQDKAILEAIYNGIRGRTCKEGTLEELINLQIDKKSPDFKLNVLKLVKNNGNTRYIKVSEKTMEILLAAKEQKEYVSNNGVEQANVRGGVKKSIINPIDNYVFRIPGKDKTSLFTPNIVNSRIIRIQGWCENRFITVYSLYMSGMIAMAKKMYAENGKLETEDYIAICEAYDYGHDNPEKYWNLLKDTVQLYL